MLAEGIGKIAAAFYPKPVIVRTRDFLKVFDGYSINSNDLTQLVLGIDRGSSTISALFDEDDPAVRDTSQRRSKAQIGPVNR